LKWKNLELSRKSEFISQLFFFSFIFFFCYRAKQKFSVFLICLREELLECRLNGSKSSRFIYNRILSFIISLVLLFFYSQKQQRSFDSLIAVCRSVFCSTSPPSHRHRRGEKRRYTRRMRTFIYSSEKHKNRCACIH
jgi:uncharacterized membrane protein (DUF485 family)